MSRAKPDLRATLRAIAAGKAAAPERVRGMPAITRSAVEEHEAAFDAWHDFAREVLHNGDEGEPLAAPSATLTPLP